MRLYLPTLTKSPLSPLSSTLALPSSFGTIHFGSPFTCYISVLPPTSSPLPCTLTVKLQTPSARVPLKSVKHVCTKKEPLETTLTHTLQGPGSHTLRVLVEYSNGLVLRKFYKFNVLQPFSHSFSTSTLSSQTLVTVSTLSHLLESSKCTLKFLSLSFPAQSKTFTLNSDDDKDKDNDEDSNEDAENPSEVAISTFNHTTIEDDDNNSDDDNNDENDNDVELLEITPPSPP
ncbi:hypothetical protein TrVE_jg6293 [Triparma verrucosa]|uniref:Trafficking protein particle complex subunit 13 N-terminal domain-containing protein n=2 Tax=Triparma TaxID=722752 RepID=A0A9W7AXX5_9STRA|nr:hypothetical protein TrST_g2846 [Triparma strigata]GMH97200.1 hypothetical protein TrVE_jg6293 [Triparma verrucosa]